MKYKITYKYRGKVTVEDIDADTAKQAEMVGQSEAKTQEKQLNGWYVNYARNALINGVGRTHEVSHV